MGLPSGELEWLCNHLGHTVQVHKDCYRLHESTVEMAKVSKVLLAIESGVASKFQGKSIDEIDLDGKFFLSREKVAPFSDMQPPYGQPLRNLVLPRHSCSFHVRVYT